MSMHETDSLSPSPAVQELVSSESCLQDTAISWYVRVRNPQLAPAERREFLQWLSASDSHRQAFGAIETLWGQLQVPAQTLGASGWHRRSNRWLRASAIAACAAGVLALSFAWHNPGAWQRWQADYVTAPGKQLQVQLADGSQVLLDGDSALAYREEQGERRATLLRGRAFFQVKRDENRPFVAQQGELEVHVLGTAFSVDSYGNSLGVAVESGRVRVQWQDKSLAPVLTAGDVLQFVPGAAAQAGEVQLRHSDLATLSAWQRGLFVFDQTPLGDVVRTMESALGKRIVLQAALAQEPVTGVFQASAPEAMMAGLVRSSGLQMLSIPAVGIYLYR